MNKFKNKKLKGGRKKAVCNKENTFLRYSSRLIIEDTPVSLTPIKEEPQTNETEQFFAVKKDTDVGATDIVSPNQHNESYTKYSKANKRLDNSKKDNTFQRYSARLIIEEDSTEESAFTRVKEEPQTEETGTQNVKEETDVDSSDDDISLEPSKSALRTLYEGHKVKEEMVIGPEEVQTRPVRCDLNRKPVSKANGTANKISIKKKKLSNKSRANDQRCHVCGQMFTYKKNYQKHISTAHLSANSTTNSTARSPANSTDPSTTISTYRSTANSTARSTTNSTVVLATISIANATARSIANSTAKSTTNSTTNSNTNSTARSYTNSAATLTARTTTNSTARPTANSKKMYFCNDCPKQYSIKASLKAHVQTHSQELQKQKAERIPSKCELCGKVYCDEFNRNRHTKRCPKNPLKSQPVSYKKNFICDYCNKNFTYKTDLVMHIHTHTGIRNYSCGICQKKFLKKSYLDGHFLTHSGLKKTTGNPQNCTSCSKQFYTSAHLKQHQLFCNETIFKEKPFSCDACKKRFADKTTLAHHIGSSHSKQFTCECKKSYGTEKKLLAHMNLHSNKFSCKICKKKLRSKAALIQHEQSHSGTRSYTCELCGKAYIYQSNLCQHKKLVHEGKD